MCCDLRDFRDPAFKMPSVPAIIQRKCPFPGCQELNLPQACGGAGGDHARGRACVVQCVCTKPPRVRSW